LISGTSIDGHIIVFRLVRVFTPDFRFPLTADFEITGFIVDDHHGRYFTGNVTKHSNLTFSWLHMSKGTDFLFTHCIVWF